MAYAPRHFSPETDPRLFRCGCGRPDCDAPPPSDALLEVLDAIRDRYGRPIIVDSGPRCAVWNAQQGGENPSAHELGEAADLQCVLGSDRFQLIEALRAVGIVRYGIGNTFVHIDCTNDPRFPKSVTWTYYGQARKAA